MSIIVSQTINSPVSVAVKDEVKVKVQLESGGVTVPGSFLELNDFDVTGLQDGSTIVYNAVTKTFVAKSPDDILSDAASDGSLPTNFEDILDVSLDNRIDMDAGQF
jgi:hypothetical protein